MRAEPYLFIIRATADWRFELEFPALPPPDERSKKTISYRLLKLAYDWPYWFSNERQVPIIIEMRAFDGEVLERIEHSPDEPNSCLYG